MFYLIIAGITLASFILGFFLVLILQRLRKSKKSAKVQPAQLAVPLIAQPNESFAGISSSPWVGTEHSDKPLLFTLSRSDVIDHVLEMGKDKERYPISPVVSEKTVETMPDFLSVDGWCFGMMFARNEIVFNFVLRMNEQAAKLLGGRYPVQKASSIAEENWYSLTIDRSFINKSEIYVIINDCCEFTLKESLAKKKKDKADANTVAVDAERAELEKRLRENIIQTEMAIAAAEEEYRTKLEKYKSEHYTKLYITRKEIADHTRGLINPDISVVERPKQPQLPMSLKYKDKTYAMLHAIDTGVLMIVRIPAYYAASLSGKHPEICRTKFPKGADWYQLPADGAFSSKEAIYQLLATACKFVQNKPLAQNKQDDVKHATTEDTKIKTKDAKIKTAKLKKVKINKAKSKDKKPEKHD